METIKAVCFDGADAFVDFKRSRISRTSGAAASGIVVFKPRNGADLIWAALRRLDVKIALRANWPRALDDDVLSCVPGIPDELFFGKVFRASSSRIAWPLICKNLAFSGGDVLFLVGDGRRPAGDAGGDFPQVMRLSVFLETIRQAPSREFNNRKLGGAIAGLIKAIRNVVVNEFAVPSSGRLPRVSHPALKRRIASRKARQRAAVNKRRERASSIGPARLVQ